MVETQQQEQQQDISSFGLDAEGDAWAEDEMARIESYLEDQAMERENVNPPLEELREEEFDDARAEIMAMADNVEYDEPPLMDDDDDFEPLPEASVEQYDADAPTLSAIAPQLEDVSVSTGLEREQEMLAQIATAREGIDRALDLLDDNDHTAYAREVLEGVLVELDHA